MTDNPVMEKIDQCFVIIVKFNFTIPKYFSAFPICNASSPTYRGPFLQ